MDGVGVGVGVELDPLLAQPTSIMADDNGSMIKHAAIARRTVRMRPAGLCILASAVAITRSMAKRVSGTVRSAAGGCLFGAKGVPGRSAAVPVVFTLTVNVAGVPGVTEIGDAGAMLQGARVRLAGSVQVTATLIGPVPPVAASCML